MKKFFSILALVAVLISCTKDDSPKTYVTGLEGNYILTSYTSATAFDLNNDGSATTDILAETGCLRSNRYIFEVNNNGREQSLERLVIELNPKTGSTTEFEYSTTCVDSPISSRFTYNTSGSESNTSGTNVVIDRLNGTVIVGTVVGNKMTLPLKKVLTLSVPDGNGGTTETSVDVTAVYTKE